MSKSVTSEVPEHVKRVPRYPHPAGCYRTSWGNMWFVQFQHKGEKVYLGTFTTSKEASQAKAQWLRQKSLGLV